MTTNRKRKGSQQSTRASKIRCFEKKTSDQISFTASHIQKNDTHSLQDDGGSSISSLSDLDEDALQCSPPSSVTTAEELVVNIVKETSGVVGTGLLTDAKVASQSSPLSSVATDDEVAVNLPLAKEDTGVGVPDLPLATTSLPLKLEQTVTAQMSSHLPSAVIGPGVLVADAATLHSVENFVTPVCTAPLVIKSVSRQLEGALNDAKGLSQDSASAHEAVPGGGPAAANDESTHSSEALRSIAAKKVVHLGNLGATIDVTKLKPTLYVPINGYGNAERSLQYAAMHRCLDDATYTRVMTYALSAGCHPDFVNLAGCDPKLFKWGDKAYVTDLEDNVVRFFLTGLTASQSQLFGSVNGKAYNNNGRSSIELLPAVAVGRRALGVIAAFDDWKSVRTYTKNGALNLSTLCESKRGAATGSMATETDNWPTDSAPDKPLWRSNVLQAFADVPVYDGRGVSFDLANFQNLPRVTADIPKGSVVCAVFTLRKYGSPLTVGFNVMSVIWLADRGDAQATANAIPELPHTKVLE